MISDVNIAAWRKSTQRFIVEKSNEADSHEEEEVEPIEIVQYKCRYESQRILCTPLIRAFKQ
jgi:hypothetical protein